MYLVTTGQIPLPWEQNDSINITDAYGNPVYIPTTTVFSLAFSLLSMTKAIVYFNIARIHVGVSIRFLNPHNTLIIIRNFVYKSLLIFDCTANIVANSL